MAAMKYSQSMSSLESVRLKCLMRTPEGTHNKMNKGRLCHTLSSKKPRRTFAKKMWRRSWGFEEALMDCEMADAKLNGSSVEVVQDLISLSTFLQDYNQLCDWLNGIQVLRGQCAKEDELVHLGNELLQRRQWRINVIEAGKALSDGNPSFRHECEWRLRHLNAQWDALEKILFCQAENEFQTNSSSREDSCSSFGIEWLKEWLTEMEDQLKPLDFRLMWTKEGLDEEIQRYQELQSSIDSLTPQVHSSLKLFTPKEEGKKQRLEKRWWQLRLRVLEWIQHLNGIQDKIVNQRSSTPRKKAHGYRSSYYPSSDEECEPLNKYRRIGSYKDVQVVPGSRQYYDFDTEGLTYKMGQKKEGEVDRQVQDGMDANSTPTLSSLSDFIHFDETSRKTSSSSSLSSSTSNSSLKRKFDQTESYFDKFEHFYDFASIEPQSNNNVGFYSFKYEEGVQVQAREQRHENENDESLEQCQVHEQEQEETQECEEKDKLISCGTREEQEQEKDQDQMDKNVKERPIAVVVPLEEEITNLVAKAEQLVAKKSQNILSKLIGSEEDEEHEHDGTRINNDYHLETTSEMVINKKRNLVRNGKKRVRRWVRDNTKEPNNLKKLSSPSPSPCDADAESSESDNGSASSENLSEGCSSFDPTLTTFSLNSSFFLTQTLSTLRQRKQNSSLSSLERRSQQVTLRNKRQAYRKQRPKSFTEVTPTKPWEAVGNMVSSDTALNLNRTWPEDDREDDIDRESSSVEEEEKEECYRKQRQGKRRNWRKQNRSFGDLVSINRSTSFVFSNGKQVKEEEKEYNVPEGYTCPKPMFQISGPVSVPEASGLQQSDLSSMNTNNEQDWDSYQEKYLSEPYSEEAYDPNDTLKLLAFGEDYGQYLQSNDVDSLISSDASTSAFKTIRKKKKVTRRRISGSELSIQSSDSFDIQAFIKQAKDELRTLERVDFDFNSPETDKLITSCTTTLTALNTLLSTMDAKSALYATLKTLISSFAQIHSHLTLCSQMNNLKSSFSQTQSQFASIDPFEAQDLKNLSEKMKRIDSMLQELLERKSKLQNLNEFSFMQEGDVSSIRTQIEELYALFEENFELGTFLLSKMKMLHSAWSAFDEEKAAFEQSLHHRPCSSDSGHGTDDYYDSMSDSDFEFRERKKKLLELRQRAGEIRSWLPEGSPVVNVIEQELTCAEQNLEDLRRSSELTRPFSRLKIIHPTTRKQLRSGRNKWRIIRRMVFFNFALMGLFLAAAWFMSPTCCEYTNTFCFSLVPQLKHEGVPPI